tara:strand:+ start:741 stop:1847 length:1107 start_codon:yes stop_codon:yes gene_type:complete
MNDIYIYADESGNTGLNITDEQKYFFEAAIMATEDITPLIKGTIDKYCQRGDDTAERLHAIDLKDSQISEICSKLLYDLRKTNYKIHYSIIEKEFLAVAKFFELVFDSGDNPEMEWSRYNIRVFRHSLLLNLNSIFSSDLKNQFWTFYIEGDLSCISIVSEKILDRISEISDPQIKDIFTRSLTYAKENSHHFTLPPRGKRYKKVESPNIIAFQDLLIKSHEFSVHMDKNKVKVIHDQNDEFKRLFRHAFNDSKEQVILEDHEGQLPSIRQEKSCLNELSIESSTDNYGLQAIDLFLSLIRKKYLENYTSHATRKILSKSTVLEISEIGSKRTSTIIQKRRCNNEFLTLKKQKKNRARAKANRKRSKN